MGWTISGARITDMRYEDAGERWHAPDGVSASGDPPDAPQVYVDEESGMEIEHLPADTLFVRGRDVRMVHLPADLDFSSAMEKMRHERGRGDRERATKYMPSLPKGVPTQGMGAPGRHGV